MRKFKYIVIFIQLAVILYLLWAGFNVPSVTNSHAYDNSQAIKKINDLIHAVLSLNKSKGIAWIFFNNFFINAQILKMGIISELPSIYMVIVSLIIFMYTLFKGGTVLFESTDNDLLLSLPIKDTTILNSRVIYLYFTNFAITFGVMISLLISLMINTNLVSFGFFIIFMLSLFFIPIIPMLLALILNTIIIKLSVKSKFYSFTYVFSNLMIACLLMLYVTSVIMFNKDVLSTRFSFDDILRIVVAIYPIAGIYYQSLINLNLFSFALFILLPVTLYYVFIKIISKNFKSISSMLSSVNAVTKNSKSLKIDNRSALKELYRKEIKKYFSSPLYVLNTAIVPLILIVLAGAFLFAPPELIAKSLNTPQLSEWIKTFPALVSSTIIGLCIITASSLSLEAKNKWILETIPVKSETIYLSKILVHLTIALPSVIISSIFFIISLRMNFTEALLQIIVPCAMTLFSAVFGMLMNAKFTNYDWKNEAQVIKRGTAVTLTFFTCFAVTAIPFIFIGAFNFKFCLLIEFIYAVLLILISNILYSYLCKQKI